MVLRLKCLCRFDNFLNDFSQYSQVYMFNVRWLESEWRNKIPVHIFNMNFIKDIILTLQFSLSSHLKVGDKGDKGNLYIYLSIHLSIYLSIYLSLHVSFHLSVHLSIHISMHLSIHLSVHLSIHLSIKSTYPSIYPSIYPSTYSSIYPFIYLFIYSSI